MLGVYKSFQSRRADNITNLSWIPEKIPSFYITFLMHTSFFNRDAHFLSKKDGDSLQFLSSYELENPGK